MRISNQMIYSTQILDMNTALTNYMDVGEQAATQKQVNRPSDDPAGTALILMYRSQISDTEQYQENVDTATGWAEMAIGAFNTVQSTIMSLEVLAEQVASGTYTEENRDQVAYEARNLFEQLINLANTRYEGKTIFAGQNYDESAFVEGLAVDCNDPAFQQSLENALNADPPSWVTFNGPLEQSAMVRFDTATTLGSSNPNDTTYQYSLDGGETWETGTVPAGESYIDLGGVRMTLPDNTAVPAFDDDHVDDETQLVIRPTAYYQGADNDMPAQITNRGLNNAFDPNATGTFSSDIEIRFDEDVDFTVPGQDYNYSYSTDGGFTWIEGTGNTSQDFVAIPGGSLNLDIAAGGSITAGAQVTVNPQRTNLDFETTGDYLSTVNSDGKDIFGGLYYSKTEDGEDILLNAYDGGAENLFEVAGRLVAACETNSQDNASKALDELTVALEGILTANASMGAKLSSLGVSDSFLQITKEDQTSRKSYIEDVDVTTLYSNLSKTQMAYETVLRSSSMIMGLNLTKFM